MNGYELDKWIQKGYQTSRTPQNQWERVLGLVSIHLEKDLFTLSMWFKHRSIYISKNTSDLIVYNERLKITEG